MAVAAQQHLRLVLGDRHLLLLLGRLHTSLPPLGCCAHLSLAVYTSVRAGPRSTEGAISNKRWPGFAAPASHHTRLRGSGAAAGGKTDHISIHIRESGPVKCKSAVLLSLLAATAQTNA